MFTWRIFLVAWILAGVLPMAGVSILIDKYVKLPWHEIILRHLISFSLGFIYPLYWIGTYNYIKESPVAFILLVESRFQKRPPSFWNREWWTKKDV